MNINFTDVHTNKGFYRFLNKHSNIPRTTYHDLAKHLITPLPTHDRLYPDCPHDTAILIVVTYVDDNLVFTNCEALRQQFATHCSKRVRFHDEGPARWYLGTQYDRDPITGAVSASQELYINKLLARWHMSDCNPTKIPRQARRGPHTSPTGACNSRPSTSARIQGAHRQPTFPPDLHDPRDQLDRICPRTIHDHSRRASHGCCKESPAIPSISQESTPQWCELDNALPGIIHAYADASFADIPDISLSSIGYVFLINGGAISWRSTRPR